MNNIDQRHTRFEPGAPVPEGMIPLHVPELRGNEWRYIKECLDTNWVSSVGPFVDRFESAVADYVGAKHAVATVNGTAALHMALLAAGVEPDDEVLVSALTFIAPANAIRYAGAWPIFIDAEPLYWQMDTVKAIDFLEKECQWRNGSLYNKCTGRRIKAVLPVHILGHPCDINSLLDIARKYGLVVINDGAECLGAKYETHRVGRLGDLTCFSFNGNKIITAGGGGVIVTDNEAWANKARYLSTQAKDDPIEYVHKEVGYNYRLTNLQAALGCAQLERLDDYIAVKRRIASTYDRQLQDVQGIRPMSEAPWAYSTFWMYTVLVDDVEYGMSSRRLLRELAENGIQSRPLWQPLHRSQVFSNVPFMECRTADKIHQKALSLPCSVGLTAEQQSKVCVRIKRLSQTYS